MTFKGMREKLDKTVNKPKPNVKSLLTNPAFGTVMSPTGEKTVPGKEVRQEALRRRLKGMKSGMKDRVDQPVVEDKK